MASIPIKSDEELYWNYIVFVTIFTLLLSVYIFWKKIILLRDRGFASFYSWFIQKYNRDDFIKQTRSELFAKMAQLAPSSSDLRRRGQLRILEIGAGPGCNFEYFPTESRVIVVEPNPYFERIFKASIEKHLSLSLEKWIMCSGENMLEVDTESVDAVVTTHVLCSADNVPKLLKEVQRVLVPGGKYYYMEHVADSPNTLLYVLQCIAKVVYWKAVSNCNLVVNSGDHILNAGFSKVEQRPVRVHIKSPWFYQIVFYMIEPHIVGVATK